jgi:NAD(P)-dependent dehydrogenase (short-subunit alcohol dehydrogenase family)
MREVHALVRERFGRIDGVLHAAGLADGGLIAFRSRELTEKVLAPKVRGTLVLDEVLRDDPPDFLVLCSSLSSVMPAPGSVAYCAANAFLDAFAHRKAAQGEGHVVSLNWDGVREIGMTVDSARGMATDLGLADYRELLAHDRHVLEPREIPEVFARALGSGLPQVLVSTVDLPGRIASLAAAPAAASAKPASSWSRPELEAAFTEVWKDFFGVAEVGGHQNFFDFGATSLDIVQIGRRLSERLGSDVPVTALFNHPSINALVGSLLDGEAAGDGEPEGAAGPEPDRAEVVRVGKQRRLDRISKRRAAG